MALRGWLWVNPSRVTAGTLLCLVMGLESGPGAAPGETSTPAGAPAPQGRAASRPRRASLGGRPAQDRELRAQGRQTLRNLLEAGLAEFDERGFQADRVDDIVRRARNRSETTG